MIPEITALWVIALLLLYPVVPNERMFRPIIETISARDWSIVTGITRVQQQTADARQSLDRRVDELTSTHVTRRRDRASWPFVVNVRTAS